MPLVVQISEREYLCVSHMWRELHAEDRVYVYVAVTASRQGGADSALLDRCHILSVFIFWPPFDLVDCGLT